MQAERSLHVARRKDGVDMKQKYCPCCGEPLTEHCDCLRELAEEEAQLIEDYENSPETQYGWYQQDVIENGHFHNR